MIWIAVSILASCFQTVRTAIQKHLKSDLSTSAVNWVRYGFGLPFAILYVLLLLMFGNQTLPEASAVFIIYCTAAGVAQILATSLLISLFDRRNFAVGTTYAKTEGIQTAFFGLVLFGESISTLGWFAIIIGALGIMLISTVEGKITPIKLLSSLSGKTALTGIASGAAFSFSGLFIRQATLSLNESFIINAGYTLVVVMTIQVVLLGTFIMYRRRECFSDIIQKWKLCLAVGLTSAIGSIGWFTAFALTNAAYVKTVGQIELLFSILITHHFFKEKMSGKEILGMTMVVGSIILLVYSVY